MVLLDYGIYGIYGFVFLYLKGKKKFSSGFENVF